MLQDHTVSRSFALFTAFAAVVILAVCATYADTEEPESTDIALSDLLDTEETGAETVEEPVVAVDPSIPNVAAGRALAAACSACHGSDGNAPIPEYSNLAGQGEKYLYKQLKLIQSGDREIPLMAGQLTAMDDHDLRDMAAYYASLPGRIGQSSEEDLELGEAIYRGGIMDKQVAACTACHAPNGNGNSLAGFPRLSGQPVEYTIAQLKAYREGDRTSDEYVSGMMRDVAAKLTDTEIEALANYITGLY